MLSADPCRYLNIDYVDAINELQLAKNALEQIQSAEGHQETDEKAAMERMHKANHAVLEKRKALEECHAKHNGKKLDG